MLWWPVTSIAMAQPISRSRNSARAEFVNSVTKCARESQIALYLVRAFPPCGEFLLRARLGLQEFFQRCAEVLDLGDLVAHQSSSSNLAKHLRHGMDLPQ